MVPIRFSTPARASCPISGACKTTQVIPAAVQREDAVLKLRSLCWCGVSVLHGQIVQGIREPRRVGSEVHPFACSRNHRDGDNNLNRTSSANTFTLINSTSKAALTGRGGLGLAEDINILRADRKCRHDADQDSNCDSSEQPRSSVRHCCWDHRCRSSLQDTSVEVVGRKRPAT